MSSIAETIIDADIKETATQLPKACGYSILCAVPDIEAQYDTGIQVNIHGKAFRIIYDDQVRSVVQDPRGVRRQ